jgi:hypothetical protein
MSETHLCIVVSYCRAANTNPDNPSAGTDWLNAGSCMDSLGVMASFVQTMADNTEAAYPDEDRLLLLSDNIQAHYVVLQYGVDERVCLPAANLTANQDDLLPRCNMDVSKGGGRGGGGCACFQFRTKCRLW